MMKSHLYDVIFSHSPLKIGLYNRDDKMNIENIRSICIGLPAVTEGIKWGNDLCFMVGGKMFCVILLESPFKVSF